MIALMYHMLRDINGMSTMCKSLSFPTVSINSCINGHDFSVILVSGLLTAGVVTCQCDKLEVNFLNCIRSEGKSTSGTLGLGLF